MTITEMLVTEFDGEMKVTRTMLERVPLERADFTPHPRSTPLGKLAIHVARLPQFGTTVMTADGFDFAERDVEAALRVPESQEALLAAFDEAAREARAAIENVDETRLAEPWTLRAGPHVIDTQSRWLMYRRTCLNHIVHHRAQLGVYLRLLEVPVPGTYGPSADEPFAPPAEAAEPA